MRDHTCFFQKAKIINKVLMMALFKRILNFLTEWDCLRVVGGSQKKSEENEEKKKSDFPSFLTLSTCLLRFRYCKPSKSTPHRCLPAATLLMQN